MPAIFRSQYLVYLLIAVVLLLVGANSLRDRDGDGRAGSVEPASAAGGAGRPGGADGGEGGTSDPTEQGSFQITASSRGLVVDVSGAVERPGVYRFSDGERVIDAIRRAGGPAAGALAGAINRAARLADGQQVVVPFRTAAGGKGPAAAAGSLPGADSGPISLGTATAGQLEQIEGIGPVTAADIIEFRDTRGGIGSIGELDQVSGIGPVTMEALRSRLQP